MTSTMMDFLYIFKKILKLQQKHLPETPPNRPTPNRSSIV